MRKSMGVTVLFPILLLALVQPVFAITLFVVGAVAISLSSLPKRNPEEELLPLIKRFRGSKLSSMEEVQESIASKTSTDPDFPPGYRGVYLCGTYLPISSCYGHYAFFGSTGAGKSVAMSLLEEYSILPLLGRGYRHRLLEFDPKSNRLSKLFHSVHPSVPIYVLLPTDKRSCYWDLALDFNSPSLAMQLAWMLIPRLKDESQPFFRDAARALLVALILVFMHFAPGRWGLRHLILGMRTRQRLAAILRLHPLTKDMATQFLSTAKSGREIIASAGSCLSQFEIVAACWQHARHGVSVSQFLNSESVVVMGYNDTISHAIETINKLFLRRVCEESLARQGGHGRTWVSIDEAPLLGNCSFLSDIAMRGRSSGVTLLMAAQSIESFQHHYGKDKAHELLGSLLTKSFFRTESETSKYASGIIGSAEDVVTTHGRSYTHGTSTSTSGGTSSGSSSQSWTESSNQSLQVRPLLMPEFFHDIPLPDLQRDWMMGVFRSPTTGAFIGQCPFLKTLNRTRSALDFPDYLPRPVSDQKLSAWCLEDIQTLGLPLTEAILRTVKHDLDD